MAKGSTAAWLLAMVGEACRAHESVDQMRLAFGWLEDGFGPAR
jgi:hypothetical protein